MGHAIGTFAGAMVASLIAFNHKMKIALCIGVIFLAGGIIAAYLIPAPGWFIVADLLLAYIPMAWLGGKLVAKR